MVFDLDATLADLSSAYYFIAVLTQRGKQKDPFFIEPIDPMMPKAYDYFVQRIVKEEQATIPLGLLRPDILDIMGALHKMKKEHKIQGVVIYSNNSHLESLHFVRDLIHTLYPRLISDCIHWLNPKRQADRISYNESRGLISKTWGNLKDLMVRGPTRASPYIQPSDVHFFDDLVHLDLKRALNKNYHQVLPYEFNASFDRLKPIFLSSLSYAGVDLYSLGHKLTDIYPDMKNPFIHQYFSKGNTILLEDVVDLFFYYGGSNHTTLPPLDSLEIAEVLVEFEKTSKKGGHSKKKKRETCKRRRRTVRNR